MFEALLDWTRKVRAKHPFAAGNVLEIGSYNVNGSVRECFADATKYVGIDISAGPGVDWQFDAKEIGWPQIDDWFDGSTPDTMLCYETLEHDPEFWRTVYAMHNFICHGGMMIVTTPTYRFPVHRYPLDAYRFGEDAYRHFIFKGFDLLELDTVKDRHSNPCLCGIGRRV